MTSSALRDTSAFLLSHLCECYFASLPRLTHYVHHVGAQREGLLAALSPRKHPHASALGAASVLVGKDGPSYVLLSDRGSSFFLLLLRLIC